MSFAIVILAAGRSTRMGADNKLLVDLNERPLICATVDNALASRARPAIVVTGHMAPDIREALAGASVTFADNPDFAAGMASSIVVGVAAAPEDVEGAIILLGDMPLIGAAAINALLDEAAEDPTASAIVPTVKGEWAHPVLLRRSLFDDVARLKGDAGARRILTARTDVALLPIDDPRCLMDADDAGALEEIRRWAKK